MKENEILDWIAHNIKNSPHVHIGVGDDMAAIAMPPKCHHNLALLKIDQALDQVHFDLRTHSPVAAGKKAVNRCLSDCAAMACQPSAILISVALPRAADTHLVRELFKGFQMAGAAFNCPIVGGDTAMWDQRLAITVAALGISEHEPIRRSGARVGDTLCVTGKLGGSLAGRHLDFTPRIHLAHRLVNAMNIHAMMDISDGLAMDLPRMMAASGTGACIDSVALPIHEDAVLLERRDHQSALLHALCDGEDYELLFAVDSDDARLLTHFDSETHISMIGKVTAAKGELVMVDHNGNTRPWPSGGWEYSGDPS